jgi:hypothetical protein
MTTGTIEYQLKNVTKESEKCFVRDFQTSNEFRQLIFDDFVGVFAILLSGCAFSFLFLINELLIRYKYMKRRQILILLLFTENFSTENRNQDFIF